MARKKKHEEHVNHERWLVSYADFITLLFATFTALYAISNADKEKFEKLAMSLRGAFNETARTEDTMLEVPKVVKTGGQNPDGALLINIISDGSAGARPDADEPPPGQNEEPPEEDILDGISLFRPAEAGETGDPRNAPGGPDNPATIATPTPTPEPTPAGAETLPGEPEGKGTKALARELRQLLQDAGLEQFEVREEARGTVISLGEAAFFRSGGIDVLPQSRATLDRIINLLRERSYEIRVEGHTDDTPVSAGRSYRNNTELSALRASRVVDYMVREFGFPPDKVNPAGYGEYRPIADNATEQGRQKNRRVDIVILSDLEASKEP